MTLSDQVIQVLNALCEKFGLAIDWTSENVIPYVTMLCTKLVTYEICMSVASIIATIIIGAICAVMTKKLIPVFKKGVEIDRKHYDCGWQIGSVLAIIGLVIFGIICIATLEREIADIITCITFPELFIVEYIQGLINSAG